MERLRPRRFGDGVTSLFDFPGAFDDFLVFNDCLGSFEVEAIVRVLRGNIGGREGLEANVSDFDCVIESV